MGVIIGQMRKRRGARGAGYSKGRSHNKHQCWCKNGKTLSAAWASSWVDGIDQFPQGDSVGFLMDTERRTLRGIAAHSHVKLATGPLELANHCNRQPVLHHLTTFYIIRQTAQQTTHSHRSTPDHINYLSHSSPQPSHSRRWASSHIWTKTHTLIAKQTFLSPVWGLIFINHHFPFRFFPPNTFSLSMPKRVDGKKVDKCDEIQNLRAIQGAEVQQFVTISDRMSWPLQLKQ